MPNTSPFEEIFLLEQAVSRLTGGEQVSNIRKFLETELETAELKHQVLEILRLSSRTGAAPAAALKQLARTQQQQLEVKERLDGEFAAPRATVKLVSALPAVAWVFAQLLGLPLIEVLVHNHFAQISGGVGVALLIIGHRWTRRILLNAQPKKEIVSPRLEMFAAALRSGLSFRSAAEAVSLPRELEAQLTTEKKMARERGSPIADLVQLRAQSIRDRHLHEAMLLVREAGVRLMVPLGATVLPALLFLLVVPLAIGLTQPTPS